jgi:NitT/TauT family transport system substrate-binding protein
MKHKAMIKFAIAGAVALALVSGKANAEATTVRLSHGYGMLYLPLMVIRDQQLIE